jgi:hypothetical protein
MEQLFELWEITEMKDGCVYKTRNTEQTVWVHFGDKPPKGHLFVAISDPNIQTIRFQDCK